MSDAINGNKGTSENLILGGNQDIGKSSVTGFVDFGGMTDALIYFAPTFLPPNYEVTFAADGLLTASDEFSFAALSSSANRAPLVANRVLDQNCTEGSKFVFKVSNTFIDPDRNGLSYAATQSGGSALPSWLSFDTGDLTFRGTPPTGSADVSVRVTATDTGGLNAFYDFSIITSSFIDSSAVDVIADSAGTSAVLVVNGASVTNAVEAPINGKTDHDWFKVTLVAGTKYLFSVSTSYQFHLFLIEENGTSHTDLLTNKALIFTAPASGTYYVDVAAISPYAHNYGAYTVSATTVNIAPVVAKALIDQTWTEGKAAQYSVPSDAFTDPNGDTLSYIATSTSGSELPSWLSFNTLTRTFTGTAPTGSGNINARVTATDTGGLSVYNDLVFFTPTAVSQNHAPVVANALIDQTWTEGTAAQYGMPSDAFTDPDGNALSYTTTQSNGSALPSWLSFNATTRAFSGIAPAGSADIIVRVTATDTGGLSAFDDVVFFTPAAVSQNHAPVLASALLDKTWTEGTAAQYEVPSNTFTDPDGNALIYTATQSSGSALPSWLSFNATTRAFSGIAPAGSADIIVRVTATDTGGLSAFDDVVFFTPAAVSQNHAPVLASALLDKTWTEGTAAQYEVPSNTFTDPDGNALIYTATQSSGAALPSWISFNATTRTFTGTAPTGSADIAVRVTVTDTGGLSTFDDLVFFTPTAVSQNHAPVVANALPDLDWVEGMALQYAVPTDTFTDPDGNTLSYTATQSGGSPLPTWLSFSAATRMFTGTAPTGSADITVRVTATDTSGLSAFDELVLFTPSPINFSPDRVNGVVIGDAADTYASGYLLTADSSITGSVGSVSDAQDFYKFTAATSGTATMVLSGLSADVDLELEDSTGTEIDRSEEADLADESITFVVTAGKTYYIWVNPYDLIGSIYNLNVHFPSTAASQNHAPVLANALLDKTWTEGTAAQYEVPSNTFTDPDGNALSYTATQSSGAALPSWISFNTATRTFTGTAPTGSADITVRVTATDAGGLSTFDDAVFFTPSNQPNGRIVNGTTGDDKLYGGKGDDSLYAGKGNDLLRGGPGNDFLSGAEDDDIAFFSGRYSEYTITFDANTTHYTVVDSQANRDGVDTLLVVETLKFSDIAVTATSILNGTSTNDTLHAGKGGDSLQGTSSNDSFTGLDGDDLIDGAAGIDTAIYRGTYSRYVLGFDGKGTTIKDASGADGTDTLVAIERLVFSDKHVAIDLNGSAGIVVKLIGAVFGAAAVNNHTYVGIGLSLADGGMSPAALAEYAMQASGKSTPTDVVNLLWTHVMGTAPTAEQAQSYINQLASGNITAGQLATLAGNSFLNEVNIDLVGLITHGVEYV